MPDYYISLGWMKCQIVLHEGKVKLKDPKQISCSWSLYIDLLVIGQNYSPMWAQDQNGTFVFIGYIGTYGAVIYYVIYYI